MIGLFTVHDNRVCEIVSEPFVITNGEDSWDYIVIVDCDTRDQFQIETDQAKKLFKTELEAKNYKKDS